MRRLEGREGMRRLGEGKVGGKVDTSAGRVVTVSLPSSQRSLQWQEKVKVMVVANERMAIVQTVVLDTI